MNLKKDKMWRSKIEITFPKKLEFKSPFYWCIFTMSEMVIYDMLFFSMHDPTPK